MAAVIVLHSGILSCHNKVSMSCRLEPPVVRHPKPSSLSCLKLCCVKVKQFTFNSKLKVNCKVNPSHPGISKACMLLMKSVSTLS